jgi:DNA repair exonuclease SbcCD nuclease subunit
LKIAHVADIHYRGLSRHNEYREIFVDFTKQVVEANVDHILVAGDIFHTKTTGLSPEYIEQLGWFLATLTAEAPVHIFLGNHDGTLVNLSRQDAITPIVNAIGNDKIHVYKRSGVYEFVPGFNWCVYSLFDKKGWDRVVPTPGSINIACYHGPVFGAHTADDWVIDDGVKIEMFEKYDFAMLGDIHKMQHLATRESGGVQKPWISYPGSAIQQNYGEDIEHGWLLWDIKSRDDFDVSFKQLPNPYPYATIPWAGTVAKTLNACKQYPKKTLFRI